MFPGTVQGRPAAFETSADATLLAPSASKEETNNKDEYLVKTIIWKDKPIQIITQNENGPCPLVAICNVLFLRGELEIRPPDREMVTFEYLVDRLANFLLEQEPFITVSHTKGKVVAAVKDDSSPSINTENATAATVTTPTSNDSQREILLTYRHTLDDVLSILPNLKAGLDVNIQFNNSIRGFEHTAELAIFDLFHVDLVHGWLVDPDIQDKETYDVVVHQCKTYNNLVEFIVESTAAASATATERDTKEEEERLHRGFLAKEFLDETATQLTYYGLSLLIDSIPEDSLCVLFRNNHFSTIYRHPSLGLCMLVTDSGLVNERSVVWESLNDIDQGSSEFFDGYFCKSSEAAPEVGQEDTDLSYAIALSIEQEQQARRLDNLQLQNGHQQQQQQQQKDEDTRKDKIAGNNHGVRRNLVTNADEREAHRRSQAFSIKSVTSLSKKSQKDKTNHAATNTATNTNKAKSKCTIM